MWLPSSMVTLAALADHAARERFRKARVRSHARLAAAWL